MPPGKILSRTGPRRMPSGRSARAAGLVGAILLLLFADFDPLVAQSATVRSEENVRAEPNGIVIGQLHPGARVEVVSSQGRWREITFSGAVWIPSLQVRTGGAFDLIVSAADGENLRAEPSGPIIGHLGSGTLLMERRRIPGWVLVERTAWIWAPALEEEASPDSPGAESPPVAPSTGADPAPTTPVGAPAAGETGGEWIRSSAGGSLILAAPDGDTLAAARPGSEMRVVNREGNWVRVRIDGWVWAPDAGGTPDGSADDPVLRGVTAADLEADPDRFRGRIVEMELQFISLERAEAVRADFREGEPFLLTRSADAPRAFVYVAIPSSEVERSRRMTPLDRIVVLARVRTASAALTGNPVLDLLEMRVVR